MWAGAWKDLTDSVNSMASNLTGQVRNIAEVTIAVANGDLSKKITVDVQGEILQLKKTINTMVDQLRSFGAEVTRVAREVGTEGKLGGQAVVPGVAGTWKDLTDSVNLLAANLTALAGRHAVTQGDLTRSIQVQARGEVAELKDNINVMIRTLRATTEQNTEQDWLKTNVAKFTRMMQGQRDLVTVGKMLLSELTQLVNAQYGTVYQMDMNDSGPYLKLLAAYARDWEVNAQQDELAIGTGLIGQCAFEKRNIYLTDMPSDYVRISSSGLGHASPPPSYCPACPVRRPDEGGHRTGDTGGIYTDALTFFAQLTETIGVVLNTIEATMRTEGLLQKSQKLAGELQTQQRRTAADERRIGQARPNSWRKQMPKVERKNREIEQARQPRIGRKSGVSWHLASKYS